MHYVLLATHAPEVCPESNAKTKELLLTMAPEMTNIAQKAGVALVAGPFVNREHLVVTVVESDKAENVDRFLKESRIMQWNSVRILPSLTMEEGIKEVEAQTPIF
jgi:hypothetical protein